MKTFAVYKGDDLIVMGTSKECAEKIGVEHKTIYWYTTPAAKKRQAMRKNPHKVLSVIVIDDEDDEL